MNWTASDAARRCDGLCLNVVAFTTQVTNASAETIATVLPECCQWLDRTILPQVFKDNLLL